MVGKHRKQSIENMKKVPFEPHLPPDMSRITALCSNTKESKVVEVKHMKWLSLRAKYRVNLLHIRIIMQLPPNSYEQIAVRL